jgi:hypothetical protein
MAVDRLDRACSPGRPSSRDGRLPMSVDNRCLHGTTGTLLIAGILITGCGSGGDDRAPSTAVPASAVSSGMTADESPIRPAAAIINSCGMTVGSAGGTTSSDYSDFACGTLVDSHPSRCGAFGGSITLFTCAGSSTVTCSAGSACVQTVTTCAALCAATGKTGGPCTLGNGTAPDYCLCT